MYIVHNFQTLRERFDAAAMRQIIERDLGPIHTGPHPQFEGQIEARLPGFLDLGHFVSEMTEYGETEKDAIQALFCRLANVNHPLELLAKPHGGVRHVDVVPHPSANPDNEQLKWGDTYIDLWVHKPTGIIAHPKRIEFDYKNPVVYTFNVEAGRFDIADHTADMAKALADNGEYGYRMRYATGNLRLREWIGLFAGSFLHRLGFKG